MTTASCPCYIASLRWSWRDSPHSCTSCSCISSQEGVHSWQVHWHTRSGVTALYILQAVISHVHPRGQKCEARCAAEASPTSSPPLGFSHPAEIMQPRESDVIIFTTSPLTSKLSTEVRFSSRQGRSGLSPLINFLIFAQHPLPSSPRMVKQWRA